MKALALFLSLLVAANAWANPSLNPIAQLTLGRDAYSRGDYQDVVKQVYPLLHPTVELGTERDVVEAHKLLALSYFFQKKPVEARREVVAIFSLQPTFQLDGFVEPRPAVTFFEAIRKEQDERIEEIKKRQEEEAERLRREEEQRRAAERARFEKVYLERTVVKSSRWVAMIPFGVGQAQNGNKKLAALFASTELAMGGLSIAMWAVIQQSYPDAKFPHGDETRATALTTLQLVSGGAFWALVAAGIIEAQVRLVPERVTVKELPDKVRPDTIPDPKLPRKTAPRTSWNLAPILSPGAYGLGVQGAF